MNWSTQLCFFCTYLLHASADICGPATTADDLAAGHNLTGKVAIVTGGDSGIGFAAAEFLVAQGATVVIAGHSPSKCEAAAKNLTRLHPGAKVQASPIDLSSFASVRAFATKFWSDFDGELHYLINDAGFISKTDWKTDDGFEVVFQVIYLGHFLLTELLLPALRKGQPSRVIAVASEVHAFACAQAGFPPNCAKDFTYLPPPVLPYGNLTRNLYGFSKLMMIEHAAELTAREASSGVTAYSLCPGLVLTDMTRLNPDFIKHECATHSFQQKPCPYSPAQGAAVIAYTALSDAQPGLWYQRRKGCSAEPIVPNGFTDSMRSELYERSRQWVGLSPAVSNEQGAVLV